MTATMPTPGETHVHFRTPDSAPFGPRDYLLALAVAARVSGAQAQLAEMGERDEHRGRRGRAWREHSPRELWQFDGRRCRFLQNVNRRIGTLLPPAFKDLGLRYVQTDPDAMFDFVYDVLDFTPMQPPLADRAVVARLLWIAHRRLEDNPTGSADQRFLSRTLRRLDARDVRIRARQEPAMAPLAPGTPVSCSATSAAFASYMVTASSALKPGAGFVAGWDNGRVLIDPAGA